jgi:hypothetical protein
MYKVRNRYLPSARQGRLVLVCRRLPAKQKIKYISVVSVSSVV